MDKSTAVIGEGFTGQRMLVVPGTTVAKALRHPVAGELPVPDAGVFPHAARHGRPRPQRRQSTCRWCAWTAAGRCRVGGEDAAVAREAGYDDPMYFSHQFARHHGVTPHAVPRSRL